ncbi:MAG: hypothetical protein LBG58_11860 [Planctomycetaceae bacterium]|jgi:hypothetical protein|nr:hypothetical protein [Planctomycetaceae bacterium]
MKLFKIPKTTFIEKIVITLFTVPFLYLIVFSINFGYNESKKNRVDWKLNSLPDESNRIYHPCGMSIISPSGWTHSFSANNKEGNGLYLRGDMNRRRGCVIKILEYNVQNYPDKIKNDHTFKPIIFQNLPALEKLEIEKGDNGILAEVPSTIMGERYFIRGNHCYGIVYYFQFWDTVPVNLSLYLDSLRIDNINQEDVNMQ